MKLYSQSVGTLPSQMIAAARSRIMEELGRTVSSFFTIKIYLLSDFEILWRMHSTDVIIGKKKMNSSLVMDHSCFVIELSLIN